MNGGATAGDENTKVWAHVVGCFSVGGVVAVRVVSPGGVSIKTLAQAQRRCCLEVTECATKAKPRVCCGVGKVLAQTRESKQHIRSAVGYPAEGTNAGGIVLALTDR